MIEGAISVPCIQVRDHRREHVERTVIEETPLALYVNGHELVTLMCTPLAVEDLVIGFLMGEGIIGRLEDVVLLRACLDEGLVNVRLARPEVALPQRRILTSGCSGGVTFADLSGARMPVAVSLHIAPARLVELMDQMQHSGPLHGHVWGLHTSALSDGDTLLAVAQDVGRHNTIDKIWGQCLRRGIATEGRLLLSTGRISSEMLGKAARMRVELVASRTSPTSLSVPLAEAWGITLIGYVRGQRMDVYTHPGRLVWPPEE
ncbi:MAG: formate dehydrogenase accessory sulfurtransferase FdhD [Anaerolineae bacterium]|nr:formate dehydrogenase accessory sulfurtransferase FdhD [Anaerolineae bacterium]